MSASKRAASGTSVRNALGCGARKRLPLLSGGALLLEPRCVSTLVCSFIAVLPSVEECASCHETFTALARNAFVNVDYSQRGASATDVGASFTWLEAAAQPKFVSSFRKLEVQPPLLHCHRCHIVVLLALL